MCYCQNKAFITKAELFYGNGMTIGMTIYTLIHIVLPLTNFKKKLKQLCQHFAAVFYIYR